MTVFQAKDGLRFICLATPMYLHDRAGKLASIYIYYIKLKSRLSDRHVHISAVSALIELGLARYESCVFRIYVVVF